MRFINQRVKMANKEENIKLKYINHFIDWLIYMLGYTLVFILVTNFFCIGFFKFPLSISEIY